MPTTTVTATVTAAVTATFTATVTATVTATTTTDPHADQVDIDCRPFRVVCEDGDSITSSAIIVATGASAKWLGAKGETELLSNGVHTW